MSTSTSKMFFAGTGGMGILLMGQIVGTAAIAEDKAVTFFPSYGPEMRGGTANCTVIVSDSEISSPLVHESDYVVAMTLPSMLKFEPTLKPGGTLFINSSLVREAPQRTDINLIEVAASETAHNMGETRVANIIMLGAFIRKTGIVKSENIEKVISDYFGTRKAALVDTNLKAFHHWNP